MKERQALPETASASSLRSRTSAATPPLEARGASPSHRLGLWLFAASTFFFWASLYVYVPILPTRAEELGASLSMVGVVVSSYAIAQLLLRIPIGVGADFFRRRKPFAVAGLVVAGLGAVGLAYSPDPWLLFASRALTGVAAATWVSFTVLFASYYPREQTQRAMSIISFVNSGALVIASLVGGLLSDYGGWGVTALSGALLALLGLLCLLPVREVRETAPPGGAMQGFWKVAFAPLLLAASFLSILVSFVTFATHFGFVPVYADRLGASDTELGLLTTVMFVGSGAGTLAAIFLVDRVGNRLSLALGSVLMAVAFLALPFVSSVLLVGVSQVLSGFGRGLLGAILLSLSIHAAPAHQRTTAMGIYQSLYSIGMFSGPLISGFVADAWGVAAVFYLSGALCVLSAALSFVKVIPRR